MCEQNLYKKARLRALHLLERADRTEKGLRQKLLASYPEEVAEDAMDYVRSFGYLDDRRYAENYIRFRGQSRSRLQIRQELQRKGVSRELIQEAWETVSGEEELDERELIRTLVRKKYPSGAELDAGEMRRLQGYLARRGFTWEDISAVLAQEEIRMSR